MPTYKAGRAPVEQKGFSYAVVLAAVVIVAITVEVGYLASAHVLRKDREAELLFRGQAYRRAIQSYYEAGGLTKAYPPSLDHLVRDPRAPNRKHIRSLYPDPMAGDGATWKLVRARDGGIAGVASANEQVPLRQANFPPGLEKFSGAKHYSEWIFEFASAVPATGQPPGGPPPATGQGKTEMPSRR